MLSNADELLTSQSEFAGAVARTSALGYAKIPRLAPEKMTGRSQWRLLSPARRARELITIDENATIRLPADTTGNDVGDLASPGAQRPMSIYGGHALGEFVYE